MKSEYHYKPFFYFSMTFFTTYVLWSTGAYVSFQEDMSSLAYLFLLPGLMAPFLISIVMIWRSKNAVLKQDFIDRIIDFRLIRTEMLPVFFLFMPLSVLVSIALSLLIGESMSQFQLSAGFSFSSGFIPVLLLLLLAATFEELGWRGYAFDSLQSRYNTLTASIFFSVLWSLWHLPLIWVKDSYQYEIVQQNIWFGVNFFVSIIPMGVIISWICLKNGKSVMAAIGFHFIINMSQEMLAITQTTKCIQTGVLFIAAAIIVRMEKELFLSKISSPLSSTATNAIEPLALS